MSVVETLTETKQVPAGPDRRGHKADRAVLAAWIYGVTAFLIAIGWFITFHAYWTPANDGVDQNGYAVGGRMFAEHLSTGMMPADPFGFVGRMWIGTPWMTYYPKYPMGLPMLFAAMLKLGEFSLGRAIVFLFSSLGWGLLPVVIFLLLRTPLQWWIAQGGEGSPARRLRRWATAACLAVTAAVTLLALRIHAGPLAKLPIFGPTAGVELAYLVNPLCTLLALVATYQLARLVTGHFGAILAMLAVACSPVTLELANNSNSHSSSLCFVAWGMFLLIRWWQSGGAWRAALAGFLLGYAITIRYTEGLLLLPIVLAALMRKPWTSKRSMIETGMLLAWWAIPALFLVAFNLGAFGAITGYDSTNESTGFSWQYFQVNWNTTVTQMYNMGLFFVFAPGIVGLAVMFMHRAKMALLLSSWIVPSLIVYTSYYWAPDTNSTAFMRFYLTIFPPLAMGAFYLLCTVAPAAVAGWHKMAPRGRIGVPVAAGVFALLAVGTLWWVIGDMRWQASHVQSAVAQEPPAAMRRPFGGGMAGNRRTPAELKADQAEDMLRLDNGMEFVAHNLPLPAGLVVIALAGIYWLAWRFAGKSPAVFGADTVAGTGVLGGGLLALASCAMGLNSAYLPMERQHSLQLNQAVATNELVDTVRAPAGSVVFGDEAMLQHLQFTGDYQMYNVSQFSVAYVNRLNPANINPDQPQGLQPERAQMLYQLLHKLSAVDLIAREREVVNRAAAGGRHVYLVITDAQYSEAREYQFPPSLFKMVKLASWNELPLDDQQRGGRARMGMGQQPMRRPPGGGPGGGAGFGDGGFAGGALGNRGGAFGGGGGAFGGNRNRNRQPMPMQLPPTPGAWVIVELMPLTPPALHRPQT